MRIGDPRAIDAAARSRAGRQAVLTIARDRARGRVRLLERQAAALKGRAARAKEGGADTRTWRERRRESLAALARAEADLESIERELGALERRPAFPLAYAVREGPPENARVQQRGDPERPGEPVPRGVPLVAARILPRPVYTGSGRLELARWITDPAHPLTARVLVNRVWQQHLGRGLVATPSDFGRGGARPTHPGLLDWLARRFVEDGWSVKLLHRRILLSRTYRMAARADARGRAVDPRNELLWRFRRRRLQAEEIRDAMLAVAGTLDPTPATSPHPFPPQEEWRFTQHEPFRAVYPTRKRSIYLMVQRGARHPVLGLFDGADPRESTALRRESVTPAQALWLMNGAFVHARATEMAKRVLGEREGFDARLRRAFLLCYARPPAPREVEEARAFLAAYRTRLERATPDPRRREVEAWAALARTLLASNEMLHVE